MSKTRVAVLVDIENAQPAVLDNAMRIAASLGRVTIRRGYGNQAKLNQWSDTLQRHGFAPCMQFQYVGGKNTADIELALDALEMLLDQRVDQFLIVSSDSDFVGLCRKLRERGGAVQIVGESKTPDALRHACDMFHEVPQVTSPVPRAEPVCVALPTDKAVASIKRRPRFVVEAVRELSATSPDGLVDLSALGSYLRKDRPDFSCEAYGYKKMRLMLESYDLLHIPDTGPGICRVSLAPEKPVAPLQSIG